jgi:hypothetical protein
MEGIEAAARAADRVGNAIIELEGKEVFELASETFDALNSLHEVLIAYHEEEKFVGEEAEEIIEKAGEFGFWLWLTFIEPNKLRLPKELTDLLSPRAAS